MTCQNSRMLQKKQDQADNTGDHRDVRCKTPAKVKVVLSKNLQIYLLMKEHDITCRGITLDRKGKEKKCSLPHLYHDRSMGTTSFDLFP